MIRVRRAVLCVALVVMAVQSSGACAGADSRREVDRLESVIRQHPGVASLDMSYSEATFTQRAFLSPRITVTASASAVEVVAIVRDTRNGLRADAFDRTDLRLMVIRPNLAGAAGTDSMFELDEISSSPTNEALAAQTRNWVELSAEFPTARVSLRGSRAREVSVVIDERATPDVVVETLRSLARPALPAVESAVLSVSVPPGEGPGATKSGSTYVSKDGLPPERVLAAIESVARVGQLVSAGDAADADVTWIPDHAQRPGRLRVAIDLRLAELSRVPGNRINGVVRQSSAGPLADAYVERLDASGVPYTLTVGVFNNDPFLRVG